MDLLPEECLDNIVSYVDVVSLTRLGLSSKRLRSSCFSPRYWTQVDFSTSHNNNFTSESIKKLSSFATELKILNIENCSNVNLESLVPFVFEFKNLELIKHDGQHRLLDETVAINRMLNNADKLIEMYSEDKDHSNEDHRSKFDNAVRQARALLWDALFIVVANKRGSSLPKEAYFQNIHHPQETLNLVMKKLRETEKLLQQPLKLWHNTLTWKTAIECATFVKEPRTQKIYLACGVSGEIVLWDLDTRTVFKVFNYIDSLDQATAKNAKRVRDFIDVCMFTHMDHVMILGGTSRGAVCWDFDTKQIIYEISLPYEEDSDSGYVSRHYAYSWAITNNQEGFIEVYDAAFLFNLGTGELGQLMRKPERFDGGNRQSVYSTKNSGSVLTAWKENADNLIVDITDLLTKQQTQILKLVPSSHEANNGEKTVDWYNGQLIAIQARRGIEIYKNNSDKDHQYELHSIIERPNHATQLKFLSDKLLLVDYDVINIDTGATEIQLESGPRGSHVIYSPELDILVHAHHIGVAAIYDFKTKQKIGPDPCVMPLCAMSKLDNETVLLHGNYSTLASFVNYHGRNYAKLSLKDCKVLETVETPLQVLDVSSDGKYALAQDKNYPWKDRHNVTFVVVELDTKQVLFQRKFLEDFKTATWSISAVGQFMPRHPDQVLLSHPQCGFQIFDIKSGKLVHDYSTNPEYGGVGDHIKISLDERFVAFKSVKSNLGCNVVVDLIEKKAYDLNGHSNSSDAIAFNPTNSNQVLTAGCGISVFNLPNTKREFFLTRYLDGLVETIRESEEVVCLRFSPDGKYLAAIDPPSRGPWGLEIANTLIRVYETTNFTQVSSFDTGGHARALYWLDNERAVVGMINGELLTLQLVVKEYNKLFEYIVPSHRAKPDE